VFDPNLALIPTAAIGREEEPLTRGPCRIFFFKFSQVSIPGSGKIASKIVKSQEKLWR
jgi:hypothetical protein